jgi:NADP-dependent alcohol dehydrogenase
VRPISSHGARHTTGSSCAFDGANHIGLGKDRLGDLSALIPRDARILIVYGGGSVKKHGSLARVRAALRERRVLKCGGVEPNPHFDTLMETVPLRH